MIRFALFLALTLNAAAAPSATVSTLPISAVPMEVELLRSLHSESARVGDDILGKLHADWSDGTCTLPAASLLHGIVMDVATGTKRDRVAIEFRYRCKTGDPQPLIWMALLEPEPGDGNAVLKQSFRSPSFGGGGGLGNPGNEPAGGSGSSGKGGGGPSSTLDMSGRQNPSFPLFVETEEDRKAKRPTAVKTGEVFHLPNLKLDVGAGPDSSTVLTSTQHHFVLPMGSILILLTESAAVIPAAAPNASSATLTGNRPNTGATASRPPVYRLPSDIAPCTAPRCTEVASLLDGAAPDTVPSQTISLAHLGYPRAKAAEFRHLEYSAATAFLGPDHLLFTFTPHILVTRDSNDRPEDRPHMVRAVLVDLRTGEVEHTSEWRVRGDMQYLWPLDGERILVHQDRRLRWFGPGMRPERELTLDGPLAFIRISPDHHHYAIGTIHELHTHADHAELAKSDAAGPEEQVRVQFLNANLQADDEGLSSSRATPPLLLDNGWLDFAAPATAATTCANTPTPLPRSNKRPTRQTSKSKAKATRRRGATSATRITKTTRVT